MERVSREGARVVSLEALLRPAEATSPAPHAAPAIDPAVRLDEERKRVLDAANEAGYAAGLARAEVAIAEAVAAAEQSVRDANATESERLQRANARVARLLEGLPAAIAENETHVEHLAVEVAFTAVLRVMAQAHADRTLVATLCRQALDEYSQRPATLHASPSDIDALQALAADPSLQIEADARLAAGHVRIATRKGTYESSLAARIAALSQAFLRGLANREAARS